MPKFEAVIWDMDGVLIDSEPFWQRAESAVFATLGLRIEHEQLVATQGLRLDAAMQYWFDRQPWTMPPTVHDVADQVLGHVIKLVGQEGVAKDGVLATLEMLKAQNIRMAIASSSYMNLIEAVTKQLGIADYFELLHSAEYEEYGKPHPGVYITTAEKLGVSRHKCLVIEDSMRGILAAKAAEMFCVAVPDPSLEGDTRLSIADVVLPSLVEFDETFWRSLD